MSIALFVQDLGSFSAQRARALDQQFGIEAVYALIWPDYDPPTANIPQQNRDAFDSWRYEAKVPLWAWIVCSPQQQFDADVIADLDKSLDPSGWMLNIEKPLQGANLSVLVKAAKATGVPVRASLAGFNPSGVRYDYRTLDLAGVAVDWQAYFDSKEGPDPGTAVRELYKSSFVIPGWEYRHWWRSVLPRRATYGWGLVRSQEHSQALYDSYKVPKKTATFAVGPREWGCIVIPYRTLWHNAEVVGELLGFARYSKIRVTLDTTRTAQSRPAADWTPIAAAARVQGASKRPISVYLGEVTSDEVLAAIAAGAA